MGISYPELVMTWLDIENGIPMQEPIMYMTTTFKHHSPNPNAGTGGEIPMQLSIKGRSIKSLWGIFRNYSNAVQGDDGTAAYRTSSQFNPSLMSYHFDIGGIKYPQKPVYIVSTTSNNASETYVEGLKSFHKLDSAVNHSTSTFSGFNASSNVPGTSSLQPLSTFSDSHKNTFFVGLECESFADRGTELLSGLNTLKDDIYFYGTTIAGQSIPPNTVADFFSLQDMVVTIQDGVLTTQT